MESETSISLNFTWNANLTGIHDLRIFIEPVENEKTGNNEVIKKIDVVSVSAQNKIAVISGYSELSKMYDVAPILTSIGADYDIYNNNYVNLYTKNLSLLSKYNVVIFYKTGKSITPEEYETFKTYMELGGGLIATGFDSLINDQLLADVVKSSSVGDDMNRPGMIVVEEHPITNGPYGCIPEGYNVAGLYADCDAVEADTTMNAVTVAELYDGYDKIIATSPGNGSKVVFWNGNGANDWLNLNCINCRRMLKNTLEWMLQMNPKPDLSASISLDSENTTHNENVIIKAAIENSGRINDGNLSEINVSFYLDNVYKNSKILNLNNVSKEQINFSWTAVAGAHNITLILDSKDEVNESDETDNNVTAQITVAITCEDCSDCNDKLTGNYPLVFLNNSILNHSGTCIVFEAGNVVFNCRGYMIEGDDSGSGWDYGIYLNGKSGNTIKNCMITNFSYGMYLNYSSGITLQGNEISNNGVGIYSKNSNSIINSNFVCENSVLDFNSSDWYGSDGTNNTCKNADGWDDTDRQGCSFRCYHKCDLNRDGIHIQDYSDLIAAYKCFFGIEMNCDKINYQDWNLIKTEYNCLVNNN